MAERGSYKTRQQSEIQRLLEKYSNHFFSVDEFGEHLREEGVRIGHTTIYRTLEKLALDGQVMKIPSVGGNPAQYRFSKKEEQGGYGKLVCLTCGKKLPMDCGCIRHFSSHIQEAHGFHLSPQYSILYGHCEVCGKRK